MHTCVRDLTVSPLTIENMMKTKNRTVLSEYSIGAGERKFSALIAADLHNSDYGDVTELAKKIRFDVVLEPGDLCGSLADKACGSPHLTERYVKEAEKNDIGFAFLRELCEMAPVYCSIGNHEVCVSERSREKFKDCGAILLDDDYAKCGDFMIGGLSSGGAHGIFHGSDAPNLDFIDEFSKPDGRKILICHHPEYWERHIRGKGIFVTVSGHAHGGQWRFFGRGLFAPGQGVFPKYTSGVHEKNGEFLVVSRGLRKKCELPRINNRPELVLLNIYY